MRNRRYSHTTQILKLFSDTFKTENQETKSSTEQTLEGKIEPHYHWSLEFRNFNVSKNGGATIQEGSKQGQIRVWETIGGFIRDSRNGVFCFHHLVSFEVQICYSGENEMQILYKATKRKFTAFGRDYNILEASLHWRPNAMENNLNVFPRPLTMKDSSMQDSF